MRWFAYGCDILFAAFLVYAGYHPAAAEVTKSHIVFTALENDNEEIFIVDADGLHMRNLTHNPQNDFLAHMARDKKLITYSADTEHLAETQVFVMNADGDAKRQLTRLGNNYSPNFSPDGTKIVFHSLRDGNRQIYLMHADGTGQTRLTKNSAHDRNATFSPDRKHIIFQSDRDGNWQIYRMKLDGSKQTRLTNAPFDDTDPVYSPDGTKIAFSSTRNGAQDIYVMNADGSQLHQVTHDIGGAVHPVTGLDSQPHAQSGASHPSFSPDGQELVYQAGPFYTSDLMIIKLDGTGQHRLLPAGQQGWSPSWGAW